MEDSSERARSRTPARPELKRRRSFGTIKKLRSGRYQASYVGPDDCRHYSAETYTARGDAEGWLRDERRLIEWNQWVAPVERHDIDSEGVPGDPDPSPRAAAPTLGEYARSWIDSRVTSKGAPLHPRTRAEYVAYLDGILKPLAERPINDITAGQVARWHGAHSKTPALRHKAYSFMKSVFRTSVEVDELVERNPCRVDNAARKPKQQVKPDRFVRALTHQTISELAELVQPRDRALILILAYCGLRTGEACALRRDDLRLGIGSDGIPFGWLTVERGVSSYGGQRHEGETKTGELGERIIPVPPHIVDDLAGHLKRWAQPGEDGLIFPSTNPAMNFRTTQQINGHAAVLRRDGSVRKKGYGWYHARQAVGAPNLRLHWLRHWASTVWDEAGTPEGMRRTLMGHVQQGMTGLYTHPDTAKAVPYAIRLSELAGWQRPQAGTIPLAPSPPDALASLFARMDPSALAVVLAAMDPDELRDLLPLIPAERVAAVLTAKRAWEN